MVSWVVRFARLFIIKIAENFIYSEKSLVISNIICTFAEKKEAMHVISFATIRSYSENHADASVALRDWHTKTEKASWKTLVDIKNTFGSADYVGNDRYVFNIKGNDYRLVAMIFLQVGQVYIRWIGTHAEYDKIKDIENL